MPAPKLILGALAPDRAVDTALATLGISAAVVSVSFAGYMIVVGPSSAGLHAADPGVTEPAPVRSSDTADRPPPAMAAGDAIDFTPTGSIPPSRDASVVAEARPEPTTVLRDFAVRDVFDGTALVEARGALHMVSPGDTLDGAGQVLAIERKGRGWVVRTAGGLIRQRR